MKNLNALTCTLGLLTLNLGCQKQETQGTTAAAESHVAALTETNFQTEVLASRKPVLVDFWAAWCGPCKLIAPIVSELAAEYQSQIKFGKVDVDAETSLAKTYEIEAIPTLVLFKDGKVVDRLVGLQSKGDLKAALDKLAFANPEGTPRSP